MVQGTDLALLTSKLETPIVTNDILNGLEKLDDETRYALHDAISEKQPDTALLIVAVSAKYIVNKFSSKSQNLNILGMECDRIIYDYGSIWLKNAQETALDHDEVFETLINTAEDLEAMAELLEYNSETLAHIDEQAAQLCEILQIQARAHGLIAEEFLSLADSLAQETAQDTEENNYTEIYTDNVILFPTARA